MSEKIKIITYMALSFALVLGIFLGILIGIYYFTLNVGQQFGDTLKNIPLSYVGSGGAIAVALSYISHKYPINKN